MRNLEVGKMSSQIVEERRQGVKAGSAFGKEKGEKRRPGSRVRALLLGKKKSRKQHSLE